MPKTLENVISELSDEQIINGRVAGSTLALTVCGRSDDGSELRITISSFDKVADVDIKGNEAIIVQVKERIKA